MTRPSGLAATWAFSITAAAVAWLGHVLMRAVLPSGGGQYLPFLIVATIASVRWGRRSAGFVLALGLVMILLHLLDGSTGYGASPLGVIVGILGYVALGSLIVYTGHAARSHARASEHARTELERSLAAAEVGSWHFDFERATLEYSPSVGPLIGRPIGFTHTSVLEWLAEVHPDDRPAIEQRLRTLRDGESFEHQYRLRTPGGEWRWLLARGRLERSPNGRVRRADGIIMNMTSARAVELDRWRSREELRTMLDLIPAGVAIAHDRSGEHITVSPRFARQLGISAQRNASFSGPERDSMRVRCVRHGVEVDPNDLPMQVAARTGQEVHDYDVDFVFDDGRIVHLLVGAVPLYDADGSVRGAIGVHTDITALKLAQAELERADRQKDIFLATLAHELRNPLAPIRYAAATLRAEAPDARAVADAGRVIERQSRQMAQLLDELLDMSRITRDVVELRREAVDFAHIVRREVEALHPKLLESVRDLSVSCSTAAWVHGDETRLHQVVSNLLSNAVKYTRHGGQIAVHVESRSAGDVTLTVRDDGIGIAAADLPHVFDLFSQIRDPLQASVGGLGIGLAVVRRLVELHGGTITAASPGPGKGAEFKVRLPLVEAPALKGGTSVQPTSGLDEDSSGAGRRVLVVDDNVDAADSLSVLLRAQGFTVQVAHDGRGALSAADEFQPDVAVLDLGLPDLPGEEVGVAMRSRPWGRNVQLVAVTGWGQPKDRARTAAAGFEHHLVKPVEPAELIEVLNAPRVVAAESASA